MTCRSRTGLVALTTLSVALLLVSATVVSGAFVGGAAATPSGSSAAADGALGDGSDATDDRVDPPTRCFAGEGIRSRSVTAGQRSRRSSTSPC